MSMSNVFLLIYVSGFSFLVEPLSLTEFLLIALCHWYCIDFCFPLFFFRFTKSSAQDMRINMAISAVFVSALLAVVSPVQFVIRDEQIFLEQFLS